MRKTDTMFIAFPNGGTVPASVTGGKDRKVGPHEAVKVPRDYGDSLVDDRFAYESDPATAKAAGAARKPGTDNLGEREASLKKAEADIAARETAVKSAETALSDREAAVAKAETDIADRETAVETAEVALSEREAAVFKAETDLFERDAAGKKAGDGNGNG